MISGSPTPNTDIMRSRRLYQHRLQYFLVSWQYWSVMIKEASKFARISLSLSYHLGSLEIFFKYWMARLDPLIQFLRSSFIPTWQSYGAAVPLAGSQTNSTHESPLSKAGVLRPVSPLTDLRRYQLTAETINCHHIIVACLRFTSCLLWQSLMHFMSGISSIGLSVLSQ
jgi:hypothetical protein